MTLSKGPGDNIRDFRDVASDPSGLSPAVVAGTEGDHQVVSPVARVVLGHHGMVELADQRLTGE